MAFKRVILRAELDQQAKSGLERICHERGMTQVSAVSRLVLWFSEQSSDIQQSILQDRDGTSAMLSNELMNRLVAASNA